jgi:hypothetical protein
MGKKLIFLKKIHHIWIHNIKSNVFEVTLELGRRDKKSRRR